MWLDFLSFCAAKRVLFSLWSNYLNCHQVAAYENLILIFEVLNELTHFFLGNDAKHLPPVENLRPGKGRNLLDVKSTAMFLIAFSPNFATRLLMLKKVLKSRIDFT